VVESEEASDCAGVAIVPHDKSQRYGLFVDQFDPRDWCDSSESLSDDRSDSSCPAGGGICAGGGEGELGFELTS